MNIIIFKTLYMAQNRGPKARGAYKFAPKARTAPEGQILGPKAREFAPKGPSNLPAEGRQHCLYINKIGVGWGGQIFCVKFGQFLNFIFPIIHFSKNFIDNIFEKKIKYIPN